MFVTANVTVNETTNATLDCNTAWCYTRIRCAGNEDDDAETQPQQ